MENNADKNVEAENLAEQTAEEIVQDESPEIEDSVCEDGIPEGEVLPDSNDDTPMEDTGVPDPLPTDEKYECETKDEGEPPQDRIELVAIPFINDGASNVQIFYNSMFRKEGDTDAILVAERYFFNCFNNDDVPKWDGVLLCQYNFTKDGIIKDDRNGFVRIRDFKSKWLWNVSGAREDVTFNVKCTMPKVWASHFQSFLKEMERYGQLGHSGQISFMADGDGNFRPKFKFTKEYEPVQGIQSQQIAKKAEQLFDAG